MATTLNVYQGITPNKLGSIHYHYDSMLIGMQNLMASNKVNSTALTLDNYKIENENKLLIKTDVTTDWRWLNKLTYCIEEDRTGSYVNARFYHITDTKLRGGFTVCTLTPDYWATYIDKCSIDRRHISRSNINIPNAYGYYDRIKKLIFNKESSGLNTAYPYAIPKLRLVWAGMQTYTNDVIGDIFDFTYSKPVLYASDIFDLSSISDLEDRVYNISHIFKRPFPNATDAGIKVNNCWIIPENLISINANGVSFSTKTKANTTAQISCFEVLKQESILKGTITTGGDTTSANNEWYVGSYLNGIKIDNTNHDMQYQIIVNAQQNGLSISVSSGDKTLDISKDFEMNLIADNSTEGYLAGINSAFNKFESIGTNLIGLTSPETIDQSVRGLLKDASSIFDRKATGRFVRLGDGYNNAFNSSKENYINNYLFAISYYQSAFAEQQKANITGINYDYYVSNFTDTVRNNLIIDGTTPYPISQNGQIPYIEAQCNIGNIPLNAATELENHFNKGIYLVDNATINKI